MNSIDNIFDNNILTENILILNQSKLLDLIFDIFEIDFKEKTIKELTLDYVKSYFNQLKFINWNLMIKLLNMKRMIKIDSIKTNSLLYLISLCKNKLHTKILEFLFDLKIIDWDKNIIIEIIEIIEIFPSKENLLFSIIKSDLLDFNFWLNTNYNLYPYKCFLIKLNENHILHIIKTKKIDINKKFNFCNFERLQNEQNCELVNTYSINIFNYVIMKGYSKILKYIFEQKYVINYEINQQKIIIDRACLVNNFDSIKLLIKNGFDFNDNLIYYNKNGYKYINCSILQINSEEILLYLINNNLILTNDIFYHALKYNWNTVITYYFNNDIIKWETLYFCKVMYFLSIYKHYDLIKITIQKKLLLLNILHNDLTKHFLDPYGFNDDNYNIKIE